MTEGNGFIILFTSQWSRKNLNQLFYTISFEISNYLACFFCNILETTFYSSCYSNLFNQSLRSFQQIKAQSQSFEVP